MEEMDAAAEAASVEDALAMLRELGAELERNNQGQVTTVARVVAEESEAKKTLKEYGKFVVGGIWRHTNDAGRTTEFTYKWIHDGQFVQATMKREDLKYLMIVGLDPETEEATLWLFTDDGRVGKCIITKAGDAWMYKTKLRGPKFDLKASQKVTKVNENEMTRESTSITLNGKQLTPPKPLTFKRHKK
jgi:hypothetical protein